MENSLKPFLRLLIIVAILFLIGLLFWLYWCRCCPRDKNDRGGYVPGSEVFQDLSTARIEPQRVKGAPYPAFEIKCEEPNQNPPRLVPNGPLRGNFMPANNAIKMLEIKKKKEDVPAEAGSADPVVFDTYTPFNNNFPGGIPPDMSGAQNGNVVLMSGNTWASLSTDGGNVFTPLNPTTIFPSGATSDASGNALAGALCCDQVIHYVPQIDRFIWYMQFRRTGGGANGDVNKIRIASASTADIISSGGTAWTYWDIFSSTIGQTNWMDYPDVSYGNNSLYLSTDVVNVGLVVMRLPLSSIQSSSSISFQYTQSTDGAVPYGGHISQNTGNEVFWAGHNSNSQIRIYSLKEGEGRYYWRDVNINSWNNGTISSIAPGGIDWIVNFFPRNAVIGATRRNNEIWFAWTASAGGGFQNPHVQVAKFKISDYSLIDQMQIWNNDYAFCYPSLNTNSDNEVGISLGWGGRNFYGNNAVGIMGDFVVWYPQLSDTVGSINTSSGLAIRFGDYFSVRRANPQTRMFAASGYAVRKNSTSSVRWVFSNYYILFGRNSVVNGTGKTSEIK